MALDGNGRWCYLDPKLGAMHAVAEAARKVAMTGALRWPQPTASTSATLRSLRSWRSFRRPLMALPRPASRWERPSLAAMFPLQRDPRRRHLSHSCARIVGILDDVTKAVPADFQQAGDAILMFWPMPLGEEPDPELDVPFKPQPISPYMACR